MAQTQNAYVLLETVEASTYQDQEAPQAGGIPENRPERRAQQERAVETRTYTGNPDRYDPDFIGTQGTRLSICQRTVGEHSLSGYGPVVSVNRLVRTRMLVVDPVSAGVVWGGGVKISPLPD
jgi:hypothetical protein